MRPMTGTALCSLMIMLDAVPPGCYSAQPIRVCIIHEHQRCAGVTVALLHQEVAGAWAACRDAMGLVLHTAMAAPVWCGGKRRFARTVLL